MDFVDLHACCSGVRHYHADNAVDVLHNGWQLRIKTVVKKLTMSVYVIGINSRVTHMPRGPYRITTDAWRMVFYIPNKTAPWYLNFSGAFGG